MPGSVLLWLATAKKMTGRNAIGLLSLKRTLLARDRSLDEQLRNVGTRPRFTQLKGGFVPPVVCVPRRAQRVGLLAHAQAELRHLRDAHPLAGRGACPRRVPTSPRRVTTPTFDGAT